MRFRDFILKEDFGLADLGAKMDKTFDNAHFQNQVGAYLSSNFNGTEEMPDLGTTGQPMDPSTDMTIPQIERTARIKILETNRNPIYLELADGTKAHFTYDEFRRIKGKPAVGKLMTIIIQRHPDDRTGDYSKVDHAVVLDG